MSKKITQTMINGSGSLNTKYNVPIAENIRSTGVMQCFYNTKIKDSRFSRRHGMPSFISMRSDLSGRGFEFFYKKEGGGGVQAILFRAHNAEGNGSSRVGRVGTLEKGELTALIAESHGI